MHDWTTITAILKAEAPDQAGAIGASVTKLTWPSFAGPNVRPNIPLSGSWLMHGAEHGVVEGAVGP